MAERGALRPPSAAFVERATAERRQLNTRLNEDLKRDIARIYSECLFSDLELLFPSTSSSSSAAAVASAAAGVRRIRTHQSLLQTRAPHLFRELVNNSSSSQGTTSLWDSLTVQFIEAFIREVYGRNSLKHKEDEVIAEIRVLGCSGRGGREKCSRREASPESDVFVTPKASPSEPHAPPLAHDWSPRTAYYSLVQIDDENLQLEKELAEQDKLSESFRSIINRENQIKPSTSCSSDGFSKQSPLKSFKKSKLILKFGVDSNEMSAKIQFQKEEEVTSNPDSCLEPGSSGYATGYSPKDTNSSEAHGTDTTEVVISEDIPHDDKSSGSSSVSSDPGTWDSTFPTNDDDTCIERGDVENPPHKDTDPTKPTFSPSKDTNIKSMQDSMCSLTENKDSYISIKMESKYSPTLNNHEFTTASSVSNNFFIDASSLRDENEMYLPSIRNPIFPSTNVEPKTPTRDENSLTSAIEKSDLDIRKCDSSVEKGPECVIDTEPEVEEVKLFENKKLIRRNTFDLDPDDAQLTKLKEQIENSPHTPSTSPNVDSLNKINKDQVIELSGNIRDAFQTKEEEIHTPDSLNNELRIESFADDKPKINFPLEEYISNPEQYCSELLEEVVEFQQVSSSIESALVKDIDVTSTIEVDDNISDSKKSNSGSGTNSTTSPGKEEESTSLQLNGKTKDKYFNKFECMPIVSGGTQMSDVSSSDYSVTASPLSRRKTEFAPILSGGFDDVPPVEVKKPKPKVASSLSTSWVVDMSDVGKSPPESLSDTKAGRSRTNSSGMGFFVPLDDPYPSIDSCTSNSSAERSDSGHSRRIVDRRNSNSSCGFYIDLKETTNSKTIPKTENNSQEKKLFSMFIDIGNSDNTSPRSKPGSPFFSTKRTKPSITDRLTAKHLDKKSNSTSSDSGLDLVEHPEVAKGRLLFNESADASHNLSDSSNNDSGFVTKRQSFFMFIGNEESPVPRRRTLPAGIRQNPNRHSWNNNYEQSKNHESSGLRKEHKRSSSVSYGESFPDNKYSGPTSIEDTLLKQKERKNKAMLSSWHGPIKPTPELSKLISNGAKFEFREKAKELNKSIEISEGDKADDMSCSIKSDEVFDMSNATVSSKEDANRTFIVDEVSKAVNVNTNDLELSTPSHDVASELSKDDSPTDPVQEHKSSSSNATNRSSLCEGETPKQPELSASHQGLKEEDTTTASGFVKLSDMDKEQPKGGSVAVSEGSWTDRPSPTLVATAGAGLAGSSSGRKGGRMCRSSGPEASFIEDRLMTNSASSRSLGRLFPHLAPTSRDSASQASSLQSSLIQQPSPLEMSTEEEGSSVGGTEGGCSRLGEDLLRMFLDEIAPDVTVEVSGRRIKAHKCILSSRCQYFAGMLSGGWVESAGNVISLQGFSYNTVHFALCHIYSGASQIPETISIVELATLADMLCLEGLKEVIMYTLKVKYCHFFHKPCPGCLVGVVECLPLAAAYSLDEIYRKALRWLTRHFVKAWPTKGFASLPKELHDKCYKQHVVHMSCENVLETVMGCGKLDAIIPNVRWASPVFALTSKLHEAAVKYLGQHFSSVLASQAFMGLGEEDSWTVTRLEETLLTVSKTLSPDQACQSYKRIKTILANINKPQLEEIDWKLEFLELLTSLEASIEDCLIREAGRAARTTSWAKLDLALRRKIQEAACLVFTPGPRPLSATRETVRPGKTSDVKSSRTVGGSSVPPRRTPAAASSSQPPAGPPIVAPAPALARSQQSPLPKPRTPKSLSQSTTQSTPAIRPTQLRVNNKSIDGKVKSRYLEPKGSRREASESGPRQPQPQSSATAHRRASAGGKIISSSDSSRTTSPAATVGAPGRGGGKGGGLGGGGRPERRSPLAATRKIPPSNQSAALTASDRSTSTPPPNKEQRAAGTSRDSSSSNGGLLKRQSTFRVATKASSAKQVAPGTRPTARARLQSHLPVKACSPGGAPGGTTGKGRTSSNLRSSRDELAKKSR